MALKRKIKDTFRKKSTHLSQDRLELEPVVSLSHTSTIPTTQCTIKWGERRKSKSVVDGKRKEKMSETSTRFTLNQASPPAETPSRKRSGSKDRQPTKKRKVTTQDSTEYILISASPPSSPATTVSTVLGTVPEADQNWYVDKVRESLYTVQLTASHSFHRCTQMSPFHPLILKLM